MKKILIISDFDGTINKRDLGEEFSKIIESYPDLKEKFINNSLSVPDVYRRLLDIDGLSFNVVKEFYVKQSIIDEHFVSFLNFVNNKQITHIIVSDGFDLLIQAALRSHGIEDDIIIFANLMRDGGDKIIMDFPFQDNDCTFSGVCKKKIIKSFKPYFDRIIYIGNGYSDIEAAPEVDIVFARSILKSFCDDNEIPCFSYEDYSDIIKRLNSSYKGIIFDLDGTLIDSFSAIFESFNYTMRKLGLPEYSYEDVLKTIGLPLEDVMTNIRGIEDPKDAVKIFRSNYEHIYLEKTRLLPGVKEVLERFYNDGYVMAVSTNKLGRYSRSILEHLGIAKYFVSVVGIGDGLRNKPYPDTIENIISELKLKKEDVVYIGDSLVDAQTAQSAGISFIGVSTGPVSFAELAKTNADIVVNSLHKLPVYLKPLY
jgi:2,3-diketo-5-methylthio-1-phosphopentane phosphatase